MHGYSQLVRLSGRSSIVVTSLPLSLLRRRRRDAPPAPPLEGVQLSVVVLVVADRPLANKPASVSHVTHTHTHTHRSFSSSQMFVRLTSV